MTLRRILILAGAVLASALLGVLAAVVFAPEPLPQTVSPCGDEASRACGQTPSPQKHSKEAPRPHTEPARENVTDENAAESGFLEVQLRSVHNDLPAVGVVVDIDVYESAGEVRKLRDLTTDYNGVVQIPPGKAVLGKLRVVDPTWRLSGRRHTSRVEPTRILQWKVPGDRAVVQVERVYWTTFQITYSDSIPYSGAVSVSGGSGLPIHADIENGQFRAAIAANEQKTLIVPSRRPGFGGVSHEISGEERASKGQDDHVVEILLPVDDSPRGNVEVDLTQFSSSSRHSLYVGPVDKQNTGYRAEGIAGGQSHLTSVLHPGRYRLIVREEIDRGSQPNGAVNPTQAVFHSPTFEVVAGETTLVRCTPGQSATVRATIVSVGGKPLCPARLGGDSGYFNWEVPRTPGSPGFTDKEGVVVVHGLFPGTTRLYAEAPNHEVEAIEVELFDGQFLDLGQIVLSEATGEITVHVTNAEDDATYEVFLLEPMGTPVVAPRKFEGDTYTFKDLPSSRKYTVALGRVGGGVTTPSQNVTLSRDKPRAQLEFTFEPLPPPESSQDGG